MLRSEEATRRLTAKSLSLKRRLRTEQAMEAIAITEEDQHPQHAGNECRRYPRRKRQVKRKDVVKFRSKHGESQRDKEA